MWELQVLAAVQYLDRGEVRDVAALVGADPVDAFRTCRSLAREGHLERVRPMTYRITEDGVDHLDGWVPPAVTIEAGEMEPKGQAEADALLGDRGHDRPQGWSGPLALPRQRRAREGRDE